MAHQWDAVERALFKITEMPMIKPDIVDNTTKRDRHAVLRYADDMSVLATITIYRTVDLFRPYAKRG